MCSFRHTWPALPQDAGQRRLAHLDRLPPKVRAVQLQQVKGAKEGRRLVPAMAKHLEGSHALLIAAHNLAVDQTGPHLEVVHCLNDKQRFVQSLPLRVIRRMPTGSRRAIRRNPSCFIS